MNNKILNILKELKNNYQATSLKIELGTEIIDENDLIELEKFCNESDMNLSVKIGGCESVKDIYESKLLNAKFIIAPMIESNYAAKKFVNSVSEIYTPEELTDKNLFINIETISGINCIEDILNSEFASKIDGIVFGRTDMSLSLNKKCDYVNNDKILEYANYISKLAKKYDKKFIIGGGISNLSIDFLKKIEYLTSFETRKIVFDKEILNQKETEYAIQKAFELELIWLNNKSNKSNVDKKRIKIIKSRI